MSGPSLEIGRMINLQSHHWSVRLLRHVLALSLALILSGPLFGLSMTAIMSFFSETQHNDNLFAGSMMIGIFVIIFGFIFVLPFALPLIIIFVWRCYHRLSSYIFSALACAFPAILIFFNKDWDRPEGIALNVIVVMIAALGGGLVWVLAGRFNGPLLKAISDPTH
jgi:hypothetical protein